MCQLCDDLITEHERDDGWVGDLEVVCVRTTFHLGSQEFSEVEREGHDRLVTVNSSLLLTQG